MADIHKIKDRIGLESLSLWFWNQYIHLPVFKIYICFEFLSGEHCNSSWPLSCTACIYVKRHKIIKSHDSSCPKRSVYRNIRVFYFWEKCIFFLEKLDRQKLVQLRVKRLCCAKFLNEEQQLNLKISIQNPGILTELKHWSLVLVRYVQQSLAFISILAWSGIRT